MEESADKEQRKLTLTDKFAREKERKDISDWKKIYLYREGTFLRAFNASAWLLATYVYNDEFRKQVGGKQPLQVPMRRKSRPTSPRSSTNIRRSKVTTETGGSGTPIPTSTRTRAS